MIAITAAFSLAVLIYLPAGCDADSCEIVNAGIGGYAISPLAIPVAVVPVPGSITTVQRESLGII